jgi:ubiquinone/menaquinone biosynthesis C-methylase UbiE
MLIRNFMRVFFHLLYHPFAFLYDLVAASVSFGQWTNWIAEIMPFIEGTRVLELGHGPGHLQRALRERGFDSAGLDESPQMGILATRRLGSRHQLTRGLAQNLPFANASFDTVVSTFPTEYIFDPHTLASIKRVLRDHGRLIVLPSTYPNNRFLRWLYRVTGQSSAEVTSLLQNRIKQPFIKAGFEVEAKLIETKNSTLLIILAVNYQDQG